MGFEPTTSAVTGRRSNQLSHQAIVFKRLKYEGLFLQNCTLNLSSIRTTSVITLFVLSCFEFSLCFPYKPNLFG